MSASDRKSLQAIYIQKQLYSGSADISLLFSKQYFREQKSIYFYCFYYYIVALICSRYYSTRKLLTNCLYFLENKNKSKKNKKLNIFFLEFKTSFFWNKFELSFRVVLKKNYIRKQQVTLPTVRIYIV